MTGVGAVSGLGWGIAALWDGLRAGRGGIGPFAPLRPLPSSHALAAEAGEPPPGLARTVPGWRRLTLADRFAVFAALEALRQAGIDPPFGEEAEAGVYFGSSTGGMYESELFFADFLRDSRRARLSALVAQQVNAPGDAVARHLGATGPVATYSSACASGALALGAALEAVRSGEVEVAIAGGSDSLCQLTYAGFNALRSVDEVPCRPFRAGRAGMSFGEGAAVLVLEPLRRALARGAAPLAVLAGAGASCDAHHMTAPDPTGAGASAAVAAALADAGLPPETVDFINVHGTGTPLNDAAEWQALQRIFGARAGEIPLVASKALIGHLLGCSGGDRGGGHGAVPASRRAAPGGEGGEEDPELPVLAGARRGPPPARRAGGGLHQPGVRRVQRRAGLLAVDGRDRLSAPVLVTGVGTSGAWGGGADRLAAALAAGLPPATEVDRRPATISRRRAPRLPGAGGQLTGWLVARRIPPHEPALEAGGGGVAHGAARAPDSPTARSGEGTAVVIATSFGPSTIHRGAAQADPLRGSGGGLALALHRERGQCAGGADRHRTQGPGAERDGVPARGRRRCSPWYGRRRDRRRPGRRGCWRVRWTR